MTSIIPGVTIFNNQPVMSKDSIKTMAWNETPSHTLVYHKGIRSFGIAFQKPKSVYKMLQESTIFQFLSSHWRNSKKIDIEWNQNSELGLFPFAMFMDNKMISSCDCPLILSKDDSDIIWNLQHLDTSQNYFVPTFGLPAFNQLTNEFGLVFSSYRSYEGTLSDYFEFLNYGQELIYEFPNTVDDKIFYFNSFQGMMSNNSKPTVIERSHLIIAAPVNMNTQGSTLVIPMIKQDEKPNEILNISGVTTNASMLSDSFVSQDSSFHSAPSPISPNESFSNGNTLSLDKTTVVTQYRKKPKSPIINYIQAHSIKRVTLETRISEMAKKYNPSEYPNEIDSFIENSLNENHEEYNHDAAVIAINKLWSAESAIWSKHWWKHEIVSIPPWVSVNDMSDANMIPGVDFFWSFEDVITFICKNGHKPLTSRRCNISMLSDYSDSSWNVQRRINEMIADARMPPLKSGRLPYYLNEVGWQILTDPKRNKKYFIPSWRVGEISLETIKMLNSGTDYFVDAAEILLYARKNGGLLQEIVRSPRKIPIQNKTTSSTSSTSTSINRDANLMKIAKRVKNEVDKSDGKIPFADIWDDLQELNWMNTNCKNSTKQATAVYLPHWVSVNHVAGRVWNAEGKAANRDYFCDGKSVISYIHKYGLDPVSSDPTPSPKNRRRQSTEKVESQPVAATSKPMIPKTTVSDFSNDEDQSKRNKRQLDDVATSKKIARPVNPMSESPEKSKKVMPESPPSSPSPQTQHEWLQYYLKQHKLGDSAIKKDIWQLLKDMGWKCVYATGGFTIDTVYIPPWVAEKYARYDSGKSKKFPLAQFEKNRDYFVDHEDIIFYLHFHGNNPSSDPLTPEDSRKQKREQFLVDAQAAEKDRINEEIIKQKQLKQLKKEHSKTSKSAESKAQKESKKVTEKKETKAVVLESPEKEEEANEQSLAPLPPSPSDIDGTMKFILINFNAYWPKVWEFLQEELQWRTGYFGHDCYYIPPCSKWSGINKGKIEKKELPGLVINQDYFEEREDVIKAVRERGALAFMSSHNNMCLNSDEKDRFNVNNVNRISIMRVTSNSIDNSMEQYNTIERSIEVPTPVMSTKKSFRRSSMSDRTDRAISDANSSSSLSQSSENVMTSTPTISIREAVTVAISKLHSSDWATCCVGREQELKGMLQFICDRVTEAQGGTLLINGFPGQGKSHTMNIVEMILCRNEVPENMLASIQSYFPMVDNCIPRVMNKESVVIAHVQGTAVTNDDDIYELISTALNLPMTEKKNMKEAVLARLNTPLAYNSESNSSDVNHLNSSSKKRKRSEPKANLMAIIIIEEIHKCSTRVLSELLTTASNPNSSCIILGLCNNLNFQDNIMLTHDVLDSITNFPFSTYSLEDIIEIGRSFTGGLLDDKALRALAMKVNEKKNCDIRSLQAYSEVCLKRYLEVATKEELDSDCIPDIHPITMKIIITAISMGHPRAMQSLRKMDQSDSKLPICISMLIYSVGVNSEANSKDIFNVYSMFMKSIQRKPYPFEWVCNGIDDLQDCAILKQSAGSNQMKFTLSKACESKSRFQVNVSIDDVLKIPNLSEVYSQPLLNAKEKQLEAKKEEMSFDMNN